MAFLLDTSILVRLANSADPSHAAADRAVVQLHLRGELLHVTPQNLVEFRNVGTRPTAVNGLGLTPSVAEAKSADFEALFPPVDRDAGNFSRLEGTGSRLGSYR